MSAVATASCIAIAVLEGCAGSPNPAAPQANASPTQPTPGATEVSFGPGSNQRLDIYAQPGLTNAPMLLYVHGGAWTLFDKSDVDALPEYAKRHGFLLASTNYRLASGAGAAAEDVASAADWMLKEGPRYGGDPKRLYLMGHSSGGNSVGLVAVDPKYLGAHGDSISEIAGVIGVDGAGYNAASQIHDPFFFILEPAKLGMWIVAFGASPGALSPTLLVQKESHYPPFLLFYTNHPGGESYTEEFADKLRETGDTVSVVEAPHKSHMGINDDMGVAGDPYGERAASFIATGRP